MLLKLCHLLVIILEILFCVSDLYQGHFVFAIFWFILGLYDCVRIFDIKDIDK